MDICADNEHQKIVIENKVFSGLNGVRKDESTQLSIYYDWAKKDREHEPLCFLTVPDYRINEIKQEILEKDKEMEQIKADAAAEIAALEKQLADKKSYEEVNVVPQPKAGGSFATAAYSAFENPVAVECIKADAGLDIGATLIGMHLKEVAVPVRLSINKIGEAPIVAARTRPKFIGGERAHYCEDLK